MSPQHRFTTEAGPSEAHLRLISTSDLHMRLMPYDYITDHAVSGHGLALAGTEIDHARAEAANTLCLDIGDALEGSPSDARLAAALPPEGHPMMAAFDALGVDAATLGNHDFNYGLAPLQRLLDASPVPVILANIVRRVAASPLQDTPFLPPAMMLERSMRCGDGSERGIRIGLIGVAPPQTLQWDSDKIGPDLEARDMVDAVAAWAPELRRKGADLVIILCHSGIAAAEASPGMEHAAVPIAAIPDVDVVLAGHAHGQFPSPDFTVAPDARAVVDPIAGTLHGKPASMPGFWANRLGVVDLRLSHGPDGWRVVESGASLRKISTETPHPGVVAAVSAHHEATLDNVHRVVGHTPRRLDTYFAQVADVASTQLVNAAQLEAVREGLKGRPEAMLPLLSATAPLRAGGLQGAGHYTDIPPGEVRIRHLVDLYVYPNTLVALRITGAELRTWLERSASAFNTIPTGSQGHELLDPRHPSYGFDVVAGVTYRIDLAAPPMFDPYGQQIDGGGRIADLACAGRAVGDDERFVLATNSYRLGRGGNFPTPAGGAIPMPHPEPVRDHLTRYIAAGGAEGAPPSPAWGFVPQSATTATFRTGSGAAQATVPGDDAPGGPVLAFRGTDASGYRIYDLDLERAGALGPLP